MTSVNYDFTGKIVLVTGAGRGIGRTTAKALYAAGAVTYALSQTQANLDSLQTECPNIHLVCVDLRDCDATKKAVEAIGPIDLLVNNAGKLVLQPFLEADPKIFDEIFSINVRAVICVSQVVAKGLIARRSPGSIVNVSSLASSRAFQDYITYGASKGALDQVTRSMALELGKHQIRVNSVNPTAVMTDMGKITWSDETRAGPLRQRTPLGKFAEENDVSDAILYLLGDRAAMIHGSMLPIDGGLLAT